MICRYITASSIGLLLALPALAAPVDTSELARCHALPTRDERLDCYEVLATTAQSPAGPTASGASAAVAAAPGAPTTSAAPRVTSAAGAPTAFAMPPTATAAAGAPAGSAISSAATATATAAPASAGATSTAASGQGAATPPAASFNPDDPANFGLTRHQVEPHPGGPSAVKSIVSQMTEDRLHNITVVLENGQTWAFIEPDPRLRPGDSVTIKHASLGSFLMLTPSRRSYRVERVK